MSSAWYQKKWVAIMLHVSVWVFLFSLPFLLRPYINNNKSHSDESQSAIQLLRYVINDLIYVGFFYLNAGWLVPKLIYQRKYKQFAAAIIACFITLLLFTWLVFFQLFS